MATGNTIKLYDHIFSRAMPVPTLTFSHTLTVFGTCCWCFSDNSTKYPFFPASM